MTPVSPMISSMPPGGSDRHAVVEQVGDGGAIRMCRQRVQPGPQVGGEFRLDGPAVLGDFAAPAEVDEIGSEPAEPPDQDVIVNVREPHHVTDGAHADALQDLAIRVGLALVTDGVDIADGGGPEDVLTVAVDRARPETGVQRGAVGEVLGAAEAHHVRVAVDRVEDLTGRPEDLVVSPCLVTQVPGRDPDPSRFRYEGDGAMAAHPGVRRIRVVLQDLERDVVDDAGGREVSPVHG
jgi:hypothetical protein